MAYGRAEAPCIPEDAKGFRRLLDPYYTEYRSNYRPYTPDEWADTKDHVTFYSEANTPKVRFFTYR